jgi:hypothetical protein
MKQNVCTVGIDLAKKIFHYSKSSIDLVLRDAFRKMRHFLMTTQGVSEDKAVSLMSVGMDFGVTQVVDGHWSIHAILKKSLFAGGEIQISLPTPGPLMALWPEPAKLSSALAVSLPGPGCLAGAPGAIGPAHIVGYWTEI